MAKQSQTQQFTVSASQNSLSDSLGTSVSSDSNDSYLVHNTYDQVSQALNGSTWYTIYADVENYVLPANVEALFLMNSVVRGTGNSAANAIYGSDTSNTIDGGGGGDTLIGGDGNDTHHVHSAADQVVETPGGGAWDTIYADTDYTLPTLVLTHDGMHGTDNSAANVLYVASANDIFTRGSGSDSFICNAEFGHSVVTDLNQGEHDVVELRGRFITFQALPWASQKVGTDTVITVNAQDVLTLQGVATSSLAAADFRLS